MSTALITEGFSGSEKKHTFNSIDEVLGLLNNAPTNIMFAGRDNVIRYVNPKSLETLRTIEKLLPVPAHEVEGQKIDIFHKNPSHQQRLLANDKNLPHKAHFKLGDETLDLLATAVYNDKNEYIGAMVVWDIVTEKLKKEEALARIKSMMDNAPINIMYCGLDFKISYINPKSKETLRSIQKLLPVPVDQVEGNSIDIFHKNPEHQRRLLADDRNLPKRAKIKLGDETLDLLASPIYDQNRKYVGAMVTWQVVTERIELIATLNETSIQLAAAAEELSATATELTRNSEKTNQQSIIAASAAEEVSRGVQTVATNTEEMTASIKEIARSSGEAASLSKESLARAQDTNRTINQLGTSSREIGTVVKVISSIAQQTNLLALNATIEAARAGDAGKGFAVVANEVKELAKQTAKATDEISQKIGAIQNDSESAVGAIGSIAKVIEQLNGISVTIAAAVEEQSATTSEVSRTVQESNKAVEGISSTVREVAGAAQQGAAGASQTLEAARSLNQLAEKLKELVGKIEV